MAKSDAQLMRHILNEMHAHASHMSDTEDLDENMVTRGFDKLRRMTANWLSKKFGNIGLDWKSVAQYLTPATLRMFQRWMRQYRQDYSTLTWDTIQDFFVRNTNLRQIKFDNEISGRPLTKQELAQIFQKDRQLLSRIVGTQYANLLPRSVAEFQKKVTKKELVGGGNADAAYVIAVGIIETLLVEMFILAQPESADAPVSTTAPQSIPSTKPGATSAQMPGQPSSPSPAPAAPMPQGTTLSPYLTSMLKQALPVSGPVTLSPQMVTLLQQALNKP
jgi:hypothetical protein